MELKFTQPEPAINQRETRFLLRSLCPLQENILGS